MTNTGGKNTKMKRLLKNKKALSPVVAAIILIAVTVAVSIAVAAWMGNMTFQFMDTEEMKITNVAFGTGNNATVKLINTGSTDITVVDVTVSGTGITASGLPGGTAVDVPASTSTQSIVIDVTGFESGRSYNVKLITSKGNSFTYTATA